MPQAGTPTSELDLSPAAVIARRNARITRAAHTLSGDDLAAAGQRVKLLQEEHKRILDALAEAEDRFIAIIAERYEASALTGREFAGAHKLVARSGLGAPGVHLRWSEATGFKHYQFAGWIAREEREDDGIWSGHTPLHADEQYPPRRQEVAYVLLAADGTAAYVGSTDDFRRRMNEHIKDGDKTWASWVAYGCPDRHAAYELEAHYITALEPRYNKMRKVTPPRPRTPGTRTRPPQIPS